MNSNIKNQKHTTVENNDELENLLLLNSDKKIRTLRARYERIARKCAEQFLIELKSNLLSHQPDSLFRTARSVLNGPTPTVNELCELARQNDYLLLLRIENERESIQIHIDPEWQTVSQLAKAVRDWSGMLEPIRTSDRDERDEDEEDPDSDDDQYDDDDENPIPGHEEDNDDEGDDDHENEEDDDEYDDDDDDDDDENDDDEDDNAWALRRIIAVVDRANLVFSISPVRKDSVEPDSSESISIVTTSPPRTLNQLLKGYKWWTKRSEQR